MKRILTRIALALAVNALVVGLWTTLPRPARAQTPPLGPITVAFTNSSSSATLCNVTAQNSASFYMVGTVGPVDAQASVDGVSWTATNIITMGGTVQSQPFTPTSGTTYQVAPIPGGCVRIVADTTWNTQSATVVFRAQGSLANFPVASLSIASLPPVQLVTPVPVTQASVPWNVVTPAPYVAPTCPGAPNAPCVQITGPLPGQNVTIVAPTDAAGNVTVDNKSTISPAPYATAVSPAPANMLAHGYNAGGAANPIVCTKQITVVIAATTQATETVMVPSASGKTIYVCSVVAAAITSAGFGSFGLYTSATNVCGSPTALLTALAGSAGSGSQISLGTGLGVVTQTGSGLALCFLNASASPTNAATASIMYEQF